MEREKDAIVGNINSEDKSDSGKKSAVVGKYVDFEENFHLPLEPDVGTAVKASSLSIERSFKSQWELNKNLSGNKSIAELRRDAFDLDYGNQEFKRLEESFPEDCKIFWFIRDFIDTIYIANLRHYLDVRGRRIFGIFKYLLLLSLTLSIIYAIGTISVGLYRFAPTHEMYLSVGFLIVYLIIFFLVAERAWDSASKGITSNRTAFETSITHSVHILDRNLADVTGRLKTRMTDAGDRLEKVNLSDESGLRQSQVLIGYLVRLRERMTAHRDYYRASIDRFAKLKARLLLWHKYGRVVRQVLIWMLVSIFLLFESIVLVLRFGSELSGISSNFLDALAFFLLSMSMTLACVAVFAARVFRNRAYTSNVDVAVTECLKESAWARDSDGGDENTRLDRIIRNTLVGSNNLAVNRALLAAGVPSRNVSSG
jgi:hypothetical protein